MPKNPDPLPIDPEGWNDNLFRNAHKKHFLDMIHRFAAAEDARTKGEISEFAEVMQKLEYFDKARGNSTFSEDGWQRYLSGFPGGTVEIPAYWLETLLNVWALHTDADTPVPFERAAGIAGDGNRRKASTKIVELTEKYHLASMVAQHKFAALNNGEILSDEDAILLTFDDLADFPEAKRSTGTIRAAWQRWGPFIERTFAVLSERRAV